MLILLLLLLVTTCSGTICRSNQMHKFKKCRTHNNENNTNLSIRSRRYFSNENCMAYVERNGTDCRSLVFPEVNDYTNKMQVLKINSYCYQSDMYVFPAFNVTVNQKFKSKWKAITIRYWVQTYNLAICIKSNVSSGHGKGNGYPEFFYDVPLYDPGLIYKNVEMEYAIEVDSRIISGKYIFLTPGISYNKKEAEYENLVYINLHDTSHIELNIEKCDSSLNISQYVLSRCKCSDDCVTVHNLHTDMSEEHIVLYEDLQHYYGCYFYLVQAVSEKCKNNLCFVSKSPLIRIGKSYKYLFSKVTVCFAVAAAIIILTSGLMKWKHLQDAGKRKVSYPTVLLLYEPVHKDHVKTVICLAEFLELHFQMRIILDVDKHDPLQWLITTMANVDNIVLVSSPQCRNNQESIYRGLYSLALHNLIELISSEKCSSKICVLILPYCDDAIIPQEVKFSRQFKLPKELSHFVSYVHNHKFLLCNYYEQLSSRQLKKNGKVFKQCIQEMSSVLQNESRMGENNENRSLTSLLNEIPERDFYISLSEIDIEENELMDHDSEELNILNYNLLGETSDNMSSNNDNSRSRVVSTHNQSNKFYLHSLKL